MIKAKLGARTFSNFRSTGSKAILGSVLKSTTQPKKFVQVKSKIEKKKPLRTRIISRYFVVR